jgi:hypothetical protein
MEPKTKEQSEEKADCSQPDEKVEIILDNGDLLAANDGVDQALRITGRVN